MDAISPVYLLLAALVCSMIGRFMLIRAAWEISKPWGFAVLCVPLAPMFFRMNYKELAGEGQNWRYATTFFSIAFFAVTGSGGSVSDLWQIMPEKLRPAQYAHHAPSIEPENDAKTPQAAGAEHDEDPPTAVPGAEPQPGVRPTAIAAAQPGFYGRITAMIHGPQAAPAAPLAASVPVPGAAVSSPATAAGPGAIATLTPPIVIPPTLSQRVTANQAEFGRLADVYEQLRKEKGYLKKWDQEAIRAYNADAAKYQTALAAARAEQTELMKQASVAKK